MAKIIKINNLTKIVVKPLRWVEFVRRLCSFIIEIGRLNNQKYWFKEDQKIGWIIKIVNIFNNQKIEGERLKIDVVAGSNEEKISTIIKT